MALLQADQALRALQPLPAARVKEKPKKRNPWAPEPKLPSERLPLSPQAPSAEKTCSTTASLGPPQTQRFAFGGEEADVALLWPYDE